MDGGLYAYREGAVRIYRQRAPSGEGYGISKFMMLLCGISRDEAIYSVGEGGSWGSRSGGWHIPAGVPNLCGKSPYQDKERINNGVLSTHTKTTI